MKKKYIYADRQILAQHDIDDDAQPAEDDKYFYLHDRLGSVRLVIRTASPKAIVGEWRHYGEETICLCDFSVRVYLPGVGG